MEPLLECDIRKNFLKGLKPSQLSWTGSGMEVVSVIMLLASKLVGFA